MISRRRVLAPLAALPVAAFVSGGVTGEAAAARREARVVGEERDGRMLDLLVDSPALERATTVRLLLPPGWRREARRTWPVLYLLHGAYGDWTAWTRGTDVAELTARTGALIVMPDGGHCSYYSNWWNGGAYGPPAWETFHLTEVRQLLERGYRAGAQRAVAGLSMGGLGALAYAARHPGMFRSAASFSGVLNTTSPRVSRGGVFDGLDFATAQARFIASEGLDPHALWGDRHEQAALWAAHNPSALAAGLRGLPLYVSAGDGQPGPLDPPGAVFNPDEGLFGPMTNDFVATSERFRLRMTVDLGAGTHTWPYWQRGLHRALPMLTRSIGATEE